MKYAYHDLTPGQFEDVVIAICQFLFGAGVQGFADGVDGGRDARFVGTAEAYPSAASPWSGITIVQAKHTNGYNKTFSDADLYSKDNADAILRKELPRIKALRASQDLDHYILFSNRRLTAFANTKLCTVIASECSVPMSSVALGGIEQLELWLKRYPQAAELADIDPIDSPLIASPDDLAEVVERLAAHLDRAGVALEPPPVDRTSYERKNQLNGMTPEYAKVLRQRYLKETPQLKHFLSLPESAEVLRTYQAAADEFQQAVMAKRKHYQSFDDVMIYLRRLVLERDPILRKHRRLTSVVLFYMYWSCDLGVRDA